MILTGCSSNASADDKTQAEHSSITQQREESEMSMGSDRTMEQKLYIKIGNSVLEADLADNSSARALLELLEKSDLTISMSDYGNFEKVGELETSLVTNDERITTTAGDLILYQGNQFVIYYDTNTWTFTRLGKIKNVSQAQLQSILGDGDITVTLTIHRQ